MPVERIFQSLLLVTTTYYAEALNGLGCVSLTRTPVTVTVTAFPAPPTSVTATPSSICIGSSSNLSAVSAGNTIHWYDAATGGTDLGTSASGANFSVSPSTTTTYYAEGVTSGGCVSTGRTPVTVTVNALPSVPTSVTATLSTICVGTSSNLNATSSGNTIRWYTVPSGGSNIGTSASGANFSVSPSTTTTYYAESFSGAGCASSTRASVVVTVNALPTVSITGATTICIGGTTTLSPTIRWYLGCHAGWQGLSNKCWGSNWINLVGTVTFTFTSTATGCSNTTAAVTVDPDCQFVTLTQPDELTADITGNAPVSICSGFSTNLTVNSIIGGTPPYVINGVPVGAGPYTVTVTPPSTTTYSPSNNGNIEITDSKGCTVKLVGSVTVTIDPGPTVSFTGLAATYCLNSPAATTLTGNHSPQGQITGPGITNNDDGTYTFNPATAGVGTHTINYSYTDLSTFCTSVYPQQVIVYAIPTGTLSAAETSGVASNDNTICSGDNVLFTATGGYSNYRFLINGIEDQNGGSNTFSKSFTTNKTITVEVTNSDGCVVTFGAVAIVVKCITNRQSCSY